ncbi:MAG: MFS transporter [Bryobacterales bacterium]|nr:MFS transporter [Bryobacterales bacterium]MBV9397814.1 MFS transporter [Bryobacterales bacterium]
MSTVSPFTAATGAASYRRTRLFAAASVAIATAGIANALRANTASDIQRVFLDPIDKIHSAEMIAGILGVPFLAFAITIAVSSPLLDAIGMGLLLPLAGLLIPVGSLIMASAGSLAVGSGVYNVLMAGAAIAGIGWGLVEGVMNPLIASLYPDDKTAKLNAAHAWWPGGLVIGGLLGVAMSNLGFGWQTKLSLVIAPGLALSLLCIGVKFPPTERAAAGISAGQMFRELLNPLFLVLFCSMFLTAASELAPGQWVDLALSRVVHMPGILLLVYVSGLMFLMRHFAGPLVHKLSPIGVLWLSCLMAALGLFALSLANSPVTALFAATVWGTGVCYMWPTMLATASERFPRGGALLMGLMGTAGTLSIQFVLPLMGAIFDRKKIELAGGDAAFKALVAGPELDRVLGGAAQASFRAVAILPAILLIVFAAIWRYDRSRGGYRPQKL